GRLVPGSRYGRQILPAKHRQRASFALCEERFEHMFRDRRRRRTAMAAVLDEHHPGDLRVVARREKHEPAVVPEILVRLALGGLPAFERDDLGRAGLARYVVTLEAG